MRGKLLFIPLQDKISESPSFKLSGTVSRNSEFPIYSRQGSGVLCLGSLALRSLEKDARFTALSLL